MVVHHGIRIKNLGTEKHVKQLLLLLIETENAGLKHLVEATLVKWIDDARSHNALLISPLVRGKAE